MLQKSMLVKRTGIDSRLQTCSGHYIPLFVLVSSGGGNAH